MEFIDTALLAYCEQHSTEESDLLKFVSRETHAKVLMPRMLSGHLQGNFLAMISLMLRPRLVIEIGTYTGYSAICLAQGLQTNGKLHTIDINEELGTFVRSNFEKANLQDKIQLHLGNAMDLLPQLGLQDIDLVFIDADKKNYSHYYDLVIDKVRIGGWIIADNVLWSGKVITDANDKDTVAMKAFNDKVQADERVFNTLLPLRDGLMICQRIK
jgi:predicted O-methyltransferase YrrM